MELVYETLDLSTYHFWGNGYRDWSGWGEGARLWQQIILGKWYIGKLMGPVGEHVRKTSWVWRGILEAEEVLRCGSVMEVGCGNWGRFWIHRWVGLTALQDSFPTVFRAAAYPSVKV